MMETRNANMVRAHSKVRWKLRKRPSMRLGSLAGNFASIVLLYLSAVNSGEAGTAFKWTKVCYIGTCEYQCVYADDDTPNTWFREPGDSTINCETFVGPPGTKGIGHTRDDPALPDPPVLSLIRPKDPEPTVVDKSKIESLTDRQKKWLQTSLPKTACISPDVPEHLKQEVSGIKVDGNGCWVVESFIVYRNNFNDLFERASMTTEFLGCHGGGALKVFNGARFPAYVGLAGSPLTTRVGPQTSSIMLGGGGYYSHDAACDDKQVITVAYWKANKG